MSNLKQDDMEVLKILYENDKIILPILRGDRTIYDSKDVFKSWIDPDFKRLNLNKEGKATPETEVAVYEMVKNATFKELFTSLSDNLDVLCLTQDQIVDFCVKYPERLRQDGHGTFFLTKREFEKPATEDNLFVVGAHVISDGLHVFVGHFYDISVWNAGLRFFLVIPRLS